MNILQWYSPETMTAKWRYYSASEYLSIMQYGKQQINNTINSFIYFTQMYKMSSPCNQIRDE